MKKLYSKFFYLVFASLILVTCSNHDDPKTNHQGLDSLFSAPISMGKVENNDIDEASGLAASQANPNMLWTHNDSGDKARVFLLDNQGKHAGEFYLNQIEARDVEDIALGPGPEANQTYVYLADIGDNAARHAVNYIYRFKEPNVEQADIPVNKMIDQVDVIKYTYPEQARDAETLMIDPVSKDIYIVTKREPQVLLFRIPFPQNTEDTLVAEKVGELPYTLIVGGDISPDGKEILLKSYNEVLYWKLDQSEEIADIIHKVPLGLPYASEPQGEAICWSYDQKGYYTLSEEVKIFPAVLFYYERK
ncbi:MAG: hypothetical protein ACNS62_04370 [Candidatus Cyclobacteriaceae bacterium M3_2C_046]